MVQMMIHFLFPFNAKSTLYSARIRFSFQCLGACVLVSPSIQFWLLQYCGIKVDDEESKSRLRLKKQNQFVDFFRTETQGFLFLFINLWKCHFIHNQLAL